MDFYLQKEITTKQFPTAKVIGSSSLPDGNTKIIPLHFMMLKINITQLCRLESIREYKVAVLSDVSGAVMAASPLIAKYNYR